MKWLDVVVEWEGSVDGVLGLLALVAVKEANLMVVAQKIMAMVVAAHGAVCLLVGQRELTVTVDMTLNLVTDTAPGSVFHYAVHGPWKIRVQ